MLFTDQITYQNGWYKQNDFISITSVRVADLFTADGNLFYEVNGTKIPL